MNTHIPSKENLNVLIIDDHQLIVDVYKNAIEFVKRSFKNLEFNIDYAKNCEEAYLKCKSAHNRKKIDLFFLKMQLEPTPDKKILSGQDLGLKIKELFPDAKIIICTSFNDNYRLSNIIKTINPDGLLIKNDIGFNDLVKTVKTIISNETYYSKTIIELLRKRVSSSKILDEFDIKILYEISNGARMKELLQIIPLSKAGIEKRKRTLKEVFNVRTDSDRGLILSAREGGFI